MKLKKTSILYIIIVSLVLLIYAAIVFGSKTLSSFRKPFSYTSYDSEIFFNSSSKLKITDSDEKFNYGEFNLAYVAYPKYLIFIHNIYVFFGVKNITYPLIVFSNFLLLLGIFILYFKVFEPFQLSELFLLLPLLFEPSLFGFSLTLEREVFGSLFLALSTLVFAYGKGVKKWMFLLMLLIIGFNIRREIVLITLISAIIFYFLNYYKSISNKKNKQIFLSIVFFSIVIFSIFLYMYFADEINSKLLGLQATASTSGFGRIVLSFPLVLRLLSYFILFFFAPIPATQILDNEFLFPYEWFLLFSGISYLALWIIVLKNCKYIWQKEFFILIVLLISHFLFGSILFNIRHRVDIIVVLVCLVLIIIRNKLDSGFSVKYILSENFLIFIISISVQIFLHGIYFMLKLL